MARSRRDPRSPQAHVAVIGAGPAGAVAACILRRAGHRVRIFERSRFPRFVIGESLLPSCQGPLQRAGLLAHVERRGFLIKRGVSILRDDERADFDFSDQHHQGWEFAWQVPRADFDTCLVDGAVAQGVEVHFESEVIDFSPGSRPRLTWREPSGTVAAETFDFAVDASGHGRVLARLLDLEAPSNLPARRTVFAHLRGDLRQDGDRNGWSWVVCCGEAWLWLIPFADGTTSVGIVGPPEFFADRPGDPSQCLLELVRADPNLSRRLPHPELVFPARSLQGYSAAVSADHGDGFCLVGNAGAFLDPIFSSGVALAVESAARAADLAVNQLDGQPVDWSTQYSEPLAAGVAVFRDYVSWWYDGTLPQVFFAESAASARRQLCSVLSGYVWDDSNLYVQQRARKILQLLRIIDGGAAPA